jgi:hypothetical protein
MWHTEYWREAMADAIDDAEREAVVTLYHNAYDDIAKVLRTKVVTHLHVAGVTVSWSFQQSVGACVLVQSATPEEQAALDAAMDAEKSFVADEVRGEVAGAAAHMSKEVSDG